MKLVNLWPGLPPDVIPQHAGRNLQWTHPDAATSIEPKVITSEVRVGVCK
jgi:hypothetical protein